MPDLDRPQTGADLLVRRLRDHGVRQLFGYPGGQLTPIYDALHREPAIRHYLARHEQAVGFMADGYARASGRPGVGLAVCGPGVLNAATPLATAFTDSVPVLLISGQIRTDGRGLRSGYYHENDQLAACATLTKQQIRVEDVRALVPELDRAFAAVVEGRPGPVLFEVPLDVQRAAAPPEPLPAVPPPRSPLAPRPQDIEALARLVRGWARPLLLVGGGVVTAGAGSQVLRLAQHLGAPIFHTFMGKSAVPTDQPLVVGLPWCRATSDLTDMEKFLSPLFAEADGMLALGCRFTQACTGSWALRPPASLAQIDIDAAELGRHYPVTLGIQADAHAALHALLKVLLVEDDAEPWWERQPSSAPAWRLPGFDLVGPLREVLPREAIVVADITRLGYILLADFPVYQPRTFLHPAGYVAMGYGLPAALGARTACPERPVVAVVGDGCFLMSALELATAVQERLPVVVVLINDSSLTLIKAIQERRYQKRFLGVELHNPDFALLAQAFGVRYWKAEDDGGFKAALTAALGCGQPALIEVRPHDAGR